MSKFQLVATARVCEGEFQAVEVPPPQISDGRLYERMPRCASCEHGAHGGSAGAVTLNGQQCLQGRVPRRHGVHETVAVEATPIQHVVVL